MRRLRKPQPSKHSRPPPGRDVRGYDGGGTRPYTMHRSKGQFFCRRFRCHSSLTSQFQTVAVALVLRSGTCLSSRLRPDRRPPPVAEGETAPGHGQPRLLAFLFSVPTSSGCSPIRYLVLEPESHLCAQQQVQADPRKLWGTLRLDLVTASARGLQPPPLRSASTANGRDRAPRRGRQTT